MSQRSAALLRIAERVQVRFAALDANAFADHLIEKIRDAHHPDRTSGDPFEHLSLDDLYLAAACGMNDERAWEELGALHFGFMRQFARRFLPEPAAGDLADQVIADLWQRRKIARYAGRSTLRTWLGAVVAHAAINAVKSTRPTDTLKGEAGLDDASLRIASTRGHERESSRLLAKLIVEVIGGLSADDKLLLLMYYEQGLTLDELQRALGGSRATLSRRLRDARGRLWTSLDGLARRRLGAPAESLKDGIDLARLDFDLEAAVGAVKSVDDRRRDLV